MKTNNVLSALVFGFGILIVITSIGTFVYASAVSNVYESTEGVQARETEQELQDYYGAMKLLQICSIIVIILGIVFTVAVGIHIASNYVNERLEKQYQQHQQNQQPYQPPQQQPPQQQPPQQQPPQ